MPKKTAKQLNQERLYAEWKRKRDAKQDSTIHSEEPLHPRNDPPLPPPPVSTTPPETKGTPAPSRDIKTPRREEYERLAQENREKYPEIAEFVDEIRRHFPGAKVVSITPRPEVIKRRVPTTPSPDEEV